MEGWLFQLSDGTARKYFKLQGNKLLLFDTKPPEIDDDLATTKELDLKGHTVLSIPANLPYSFSICSIKSKEVVLGLAASNQKEMEDWVSALTLACQYSESSPYQEDSLKSVEYEIELTSTGITETETEELLHTGLSTSVGDLAQTTTTKQITIIHNFKKFIPEIKRVFGFIFLYLIVILPVVYFADKIPSTVMVTDPNWKNNDVIYDDWLQSFPWSTLVIWCVTLTLGFIFVANVTERRKNPFSKSYVTFIKFLVALPIVFVFGPARTLFEPEEVNSATKRFLANYFGFTFALFTGLQFTYLDHILFLRYMGDKFGTPSLWKTYTFKELSVMIPIVLAISAAVFWHAYLVISSKLVIIYTIFYSLVATFFLLPTYIFRKTHYLHVHHYAIFGSLIPLAAFPNIFSIICLGLLSGIYVEGISRWSMGWFWYRGERRLAQVK